MRAEKRHVELAAVERHQERELGDVGGKLVEVDALDEQGQPAAAERADHRHRVVLGRQAGRFDVQEERAVGELCIKPPRFPRGQPRRKTQRRPRPRRPTSGAPAGTAVRQTPRARRPSSTAARKVGPIKDPLSP